MPTTSRRLFLAAGSASAVFGALTQAAASTLGNDPIFDAFAEFERAKAADDLASKAYEDLRAVTFDALESAGVKPVEILTIRKLKLRHECGLLSNSEYAEALTAFEGHKSEHQMMWRALEELDELAQAAAEARGETEREFVTTAPTTRAGALRLLRHLADFLGQEDVVNDRFLDDSLGDAIRNAIAVFEREALS